jgi:hypothetical protein
MAAIAAAVLSLTAPTFARAENQQGAIDWQTRTIKCKGQAAPSPNAINPAQARIGAERAAKADAMRNILETLKGVNVSGGKTVADSMKDSGVSAKVQGAIRNFKVADTRYFDDGGVEVDVEMPLDGLIETLVPGGAKKAEATPAKAGSTGLIVDASGLKVTPALAPRVVDEEGKEVYGAAEVNTDKAKHGLAAYVKDAEAAKKDPRVGDAPATVKALALAKGSNTDVVISNEDAKKAREAQVAEGNVVFVVQ